MKNRHGLRLISQEPDKGVETLLWPVYTTIRNLENLEKDRAIQQNQKFSYEMKVADWDVEPLSTPLL